MSLIETIVHKILVFEKEPQKIGLSQFKTQPVKAEQKGPSINTKNVKLSDLMRRAG